MRSSSHNTHAERFELGVLLAQFESNAEAVEVFQDLWAEKPAYNVGFNLALVLYRTGQLETALRVTKDLESRGKPTGELMSLRGWIYNKMHHLDQARQSLEQAILIEPDNQDHYLDLSTVLSNQGENETATQVISTGLQRGLEKSRLQVQMGLLYEKSGNYGEAEKWYRTAMTTQKATPPAYVALAHLLLGTDRRDQALDLLENGSRTFPDNSFLQYVYGAEVLESVSGSDPRQLDRAESILRKALALNPFYANTYYMLGRLYLKRGDDLIAQENFAKACAFNPKHTNAYYQWLRIAVRLGEKDKATELDTIVRRLHDEEKKQVQKTVTGVVEESLRGSAEGILTTRSSN
jgi:tetratricopeptide (TPR) repeat protein